MSEAFSTKFGNRDRVFTILEEIFNDMLHSGLKEKLITTRCLEIIIMGSKVVVDGGLNLETRLYLNDQLIKMMDKAVEIQDKFNLTKYFLQRYIDLVHDRQEIENLATVRKIQRFIKRNYSEKLTLDQIADHVYLSASYLCKIFKDVTSITIIEYLTQIRLKEAKRLLRKTEMSLRDIAQLCGYYDASYFSKVFKRETGVTPGQYRKNMKN